MLQPTQSKPKINRLKRSPRSTQQQRVNDSSKTVTEVFKTPTRPTKPRFKSCMPDQSPSNDYEFQQDIVWDPATPSPIRRGRGRRKTPNIGTMDISDIVKRIAPKNGRPERSESSLLQWIGDSAIPCTPEASQPRRKTKPTRQNTVDDLLKLAKQFDFNMIRQDELRDPETDRGISVEASDEEPELFDDENQCPPPLTNTNPKNASLDLKHVQVNDDQRRGSPLREVNDDLEFLFDRSTQQISGRLSQASSVGISQDAPKAAPVPPNSSAIPNGKSCDSKPPSHASSITTAPSNSRQANIEFTDADWNSDDLMDDSLVFELTQNPDLFAPPQHSSTQKPFYGTQMSSFSNNMSNNATVNKHTKQARENKFSPVRGQNQTVKNRQTFQLEAPSGNQVTGKPSRCFSGDVTNALQSQSKSIAPLCTISVVPSSPRVHSNQDHQYPHLQMDAKSLMAHPGQNSAKSSNLSSNGCFQTNVKPSLSSALPSNSTYAAKRVESKTSGFCHIVNAVENEARSEVPEAFKDGFSDIPDEELDSIFASDDIWEDGADDDDLFREACENLDEIVSTTTSDYVANSTVTVRCSEAEIERKKQEAMERRRLRMLASQNLRGPV
ncbi:ewing's tumor-associated antigen 1 [Chanos chanos]|uniref:Ewing's tumor-associated antigen 1 n=1 Tax=Chanos chanos TaxID=29144 RepID=A0A6J2VRW9_CHACN|nr:ewing's tumor-associated antigen 1-like [Chanos chanos]